MREVKAYISLNDAIHLDKAEAIRTNLRIMLNRADDVSGIVNILENNASQVCNYLTELSKTKPAEVVQKTGT